MLVRVRIISSVLLLFFVAVCLRAAADEEKKTDGPSQSVVVALSKEMHVKRVKVGEKVEARTMAPLVLKDGTKVPSNSKVLGTITAVNVKPSKEMPSQIGILFDRVQVSKDTFQPITTVLASIALPAPTPGADPVAADSGQNSWGRIDSMAAATGRGSSSSPGAKGAGRSNMGEKPFEFQPGVSFIDDVQLTKFLPDGVGTVIENKKQQLYLESKTRMMLQIK